MVSNIYDAGRPAEPPAMGFRSADPVRYVPTSTDKEPWMDQAACKGWHPTKRDAGLSDIRRRELEWVDLPVAVAREVCKGNPDSGIAPCPVLAQCQAWVLNKPIQGRWGVWGGMTPPQIGRLRLAAQKEAEARKAAAA